MQSHEYLDIAQRLQTLEKIVQDYSLNLRNDYNQVSSRMTRVETLLESHIAAAAADHQRGNATLAKMEKAVQTLLQQVAVLEALVGTRNRTSTALGIGAGGGGMTIIGVVGKFFGWW